MVNSWRTNSGTDGSKTVDLSVGKGVYIGEYGIFVRTSDDDIRRVWWVLLGEGVDMFCVGVLLLVGGAC